MVLFIGKAPNNESIDDTFLDLITYCALFYAYWKEQEHKRSFISAYQTAMASAEDDIPL